MADSAVFEQNLMAIMRAWDSIGAKIGCDRDLDIQHVASLEVLLATGTQPMKLVFKRIFTSNRELSFAYRLDLYKTDSELRGRAPSGLMIFWSFDRDHHRISTTEVRTLLGYTGCGLATALVKLADRIIKDKLIPLSELPPEYQRLPLLGLIEDCAHDENGKVTRWTTDRAEGLGYAVTGKNVNGWPVLTKEF